MIMRKLVSLLCAILILAAVPAFPAGGEGQHAPDFLMEGYDDANHDWETNLFFQRMQEETGIAFEFRQHTDAESWKQRKRAILEGEDLPDVLFKAQLNAGEIRDMAAAGVIIDLKPYLETAAPDLWALMQEKPEVMAAVTLADGSIPALPTVNELPNNELMWINTRWLTALGLEMPTTADELTEVLRAFKTRDPNRNGKSDEVPLAFIGMWELRFLSHAFGINDNDYYIHVRDGKVSSGLLTDGYRDFLTWLHQLWAENLIDHQGFVTMDSLRQITDSNAAVPYGVILSSTPLTVVPSAALDQYSVLPALSFDGKTVYRDLLGSVTRGTFAITSACKEPEKLVSWVNRLYTQEGSLLLQVGREGEEYLVNEDGSWDWIADLDTVANTVVPGSTLSNGGAAPGVISVSFQQRYIDESTRRMVDEMMRGREHAEMPFPLVYLSREDEEKAAELQARIAPYTEQQLACFVTGDLELSDENWAAFQNGVQERGLTDMIDLWQKYIH